MTSTLKAALQETLRQEDEALKARLENVAPAAATKSPKASRQVVKKATTATKGTPTAKTRPSTPSPSAAGGSADQKPAIAPKSTSPAKQKVKAAKPQTVSAPAPVAKEGKAAKVSRESFSLPASEAATLKILRTAIATQGQIVTKSELIRAGIQVISKFPLADLITEIGSLPQVVKKKKKK